MPQDLGPLVGEPAFEQARGMLMEACSCTADHALTVIGEVALRTGRTAEDVVTSLRAQFTRTDVLRMIGPSI